jgi:exodeoxyribonuclease V gamma subunit
LEEPIHFYPDTSHEYAEHKRNTSGSDQSALARAGLKWQGGDLPKKHSPVESDDPYYDLCFRRLDPLDDAFKKIALKVFEPILAHSKEIVL